MVSAASVSLPAGKRRPLVVGNWKMNGSAASNEALLAALKAASFGDTEVSVCVPAVYLHDVADTLHGGAVHWGAQDCSSHDPGPYTGEISAAMLAEFGCCHVIVGHSERRALHGESDRLVAQKAAAALKHGLVPILCVGETLAERDAGRTTEVVARQLGAVQFAGGVLAYEPVWAIGTGRNATPEQAQEVHAFLRGRLPAQLRDATPILYGGSVKPQNAAAIFAMPDVDGGLIGGASLVAADFLAILRAAAGAKR